MGGGGVQRIVKFLKYWDYQHSRLGVITVKPSFFYAEDDAMLNEIHPFVSIFPTSSFDPFRLIYLLKKAFRPWLRGKSGKKTESGSLLRKVSAYFFVPDSRILWLPFALLKIYTLNRSDKIDVLVATMPPFTSGVIAFFSKILFKIPFILDFRDAWTNNPYLPKMTSLHRGLQGKLESLVLRKCQGVVFVNPNLQKYYIEKYPFLSGKANITVRNGFDQEDFANRLIDHKMIDPEILKIGIAGTIYSQGNSPLPLLQAVERLFRKNNKMTKKIRLVFVGKWAGDFLDDVKRINLGEAVEWIGYLSHKELLKYIRQMDVLALAIDDKLPGSKNVTPGRIYEYLYLQKPVLAMCPLESDLANLIRKNEAGEVVAYSDISKIIQILSDWLTNKTKFHSYYQTSDLSPYRRDYLANKFMKFLDDVFFEQNDYHS